MNNLNINLNHAANYLVQLFYKTNQRYSCTRTKIGKLLSIVAFKYAREGKLAFAETIYKYDHCGTAIKEVMHRFRDREIYSLCVYKDNAKPITDKLNEKAYIPDNFSNIEALSDEAKEIIESVFFSFGAFSPADLGECINPIVNLDGVTIADNHINISEIAKLYLNDFPAEHLNNPLLKFLLE